MLSKTTDDVFKLALWRLMRQPSHRGSFKGKKAVFPLSKGNWKMSKANRICRRKETKTSLLVCLKSWPLAGCSCSGQTSPSVLIHKLHEFHSLLISISMTPPFSFLDVWTFPPNSFSLSCFPNFKFHLLTHLQEWICPSKSIPFD